MKFLLFLILTFSILFAAHVENFRWQQSETYLMFLKRLGLPQRSLYYNLDKEDQKLTEDIRSGINYQILYSDKDKKIEQLLIPINDELQIHIFLKDGKYNFETIPVISDTKTKAFMLTITHSPYYDILKETGSKKLATIFMQGYKHSLDFKNGIRKGDRLAMLYEQKYRLSHPFSMPTLKASVIEMNKKGHFIYLNSDDRYYDERGKQIEGFLLARPIPGARITSRFTRKRWHPILHKYRAHLGVDFGARSGTPIHAAGSGRIIFAGYTRGYGNLIKIRHKDGYMTLYAHQRKFRRGIYRGKYVKKGQIIGYVGSTGLSTGPHLHFGLYKNGRPINPLRVVQVTVKQLRGKNLRAFKQLKANYDQSLLLHLKNETKYQKEPKFERICYCIDRFAEKKEKPKDATSKDR
ncbi:Membrane proteins related to metalloendopeptidases [hydrothermal vent metagenome]|uniref:Membrane proteins related to metalloendopeptidases n=1 Tax=hydrothermal vent metagenome TaxID=652676 RepID=A0A1W1BF93_9ZZZZ